MSPIDSFYTKVRIQFFKKWKEFSHIIFHLIKNVTALSHYS